MTSDEYKAVIACLDEALKIPSTSLNRVGDLSFHADLFRLRRKATQEMLKAREREHDTAPNLASVA